MADVFSDDELEFTFFRASGPGGQKRNKTESAVRVKHLPTGLIVIGTRHRSQLRNKLDAVAELRRRLLERRRRPRRRVATNPTRASRERRLDAKRKRGQNKRTRNAPTDWD